MTLEQKIVNIGEEKYIPNVIEPSFGLGRIMSALLEHCFRIRSQERTYLCLKPKIAPTKVSILPLQADEKFDPIIAEIRIFLLYFRCLAEEKTGIMQSGQFRTVNRTQILPHRRDRNSIRNYNRFPNSLRPHNNFTRTAHNETDQNSNGRHRQSCM